MQTLDQLIDALQQLKTGGLDGATRVGVPSSDSNQRAGFVEFDVAPRVVSVAKDEFAKGWTLCRTVSRGGVPVVVVG